MASTSPGYGITIRVEGSPDTNPVALATTVITGAGATITALDVVESLLDKVVIDITCDTIDSQHADEITAAISLAGFLVLRLISSSIQWYTQFSFNAVFGSSQTLFVLIHLPENIADSLGLGLRYPDLGPNSIGIIGVVLFGVAISSWLREGNAFQIAATTAVFTFMLLAMFQIAFYWPEANEASGVYITALLTVCFGVASAFSKSENFFPNTNQQRILAILLVSVSHALTLYSKFDWSIRASVTNDTYTKLSLNGGWWWDTPIGPNMVFLIGALAFPSWLIFSWATVLEKPTEITV